MLQAQLQSSYRSLGRNANRVLSAAGMKQYPIPPHEITPEEEENMALREYDVRTFVTSDVIEIKNMWMECMAQSRLIDLLIDDICIEN
jgi:hypothetical protein